LPAGLLVCFFMDQRIFITGIWHETNTFAAPRTDLAAFEAYQYAEGEALFERFAGTNTEVGGALSVAADLDLRLLPGLFAGAVPSGLVTRAAYDALLWRSLGRLAEAGPVDGALVHLHGACVAEGHDQADADFLAAIRDGLPAGAPLVATFDLHANLSPELIAAADLLVGYDTYPHHDMGARGAEAAALLHRLLSEGRRPAKAFRKLPFAPSPQMQVTDDPPVVEIMARLRAMEARDDVWTASIAWGFPYADVGHLGVGVLVQADEQVEADGLADQLADEIWSRRAAFQAPLLPVGEAVRQAMAAPAGPVMLVDVADNAGGGAPGDGTVILAELLAQSARDAVVVLWDPAAIAAAREAGLGGRFDAPVGGKADDLHGEAVDLAGEVVFLEDVSYRRGGNYMTGQRVDLGAVAVIAATGVTVMLTSEKALPFDVDHLRAAGIQPEGQRIIVVKSAIAWRAHFRPFAQDEIYVDTPGVCASNLGRFDYSRLAGPIYPLDPAAEYLKG